MTFDRRAIQQGRLNQQKAEETPNSFATEDGAPVVNPTGDLSKSNRRMAGQQGARAIEMMTNPDEQKRVAQWMQMFGMTNQGMQWNAAKMGLPPQG